MKEGEEKFKEQAACVKRHGAALVVMAFDEEGQAATHEDKARGRLLRLLNTPLCLHARPPAWLDACLHACLYKLNLD